MLRGITVILHERVQSGIDPFGEPLYEETTEQVEDVLVVPSSSTDEAERTNLDGKVAVYQLAIPKGDAHNWNDAVVEFFGERWRTVGYATKGIDELVPGKWNMKVMVEHHG